MDSQQEALLGNRVLLLLAAQKAEAASSAFQALTSRFPAYARLPLLQAALLAQAGKVIVRCFSTVRAELTTAGHKSFLLINLPQTLQPI